MTLEVMAFATPAAYHSAMSTETLRPPPPAPATHVGALLRNGAPRGA
jgi:hypothetical protein